MRFPCWRSPHRYGQNFVNHPTARIRGLVIIWRLFVRKITVQARISGGRLKVLGKEKPRFHWGFRGSLWWPRPGSNRRHTDFQSVALPTELPSHDQLVVNGRSRGIRTHDPVIKSHSELCSHSPLPQPHEWSELRDSNPRQPPWQGGTLPTELSSHLVS